MRRVLLLFLILFLAACGASEPAVQEAPGEAAEPDAPAATQAPRQNAEAPVSIASTPADAGIVRERDWIKGADDPVITIIEYGDFQ